MRARLTVPVSGAILIGSAVLGAVILGGGPAAADEPTVPTPTVAPTPSLSPPSQQQIDDAKDALERLEDPGTPTPTPLTQVAGPTSEPEPGSFTSRISDEAWWTLGAGLLVLVVASEATRIGVKRAKHRKGA